MLLGLFFPKSKLQELLKSIAECDGDVTKLKALEEQHIQLMTDQERVCGYYLRPFHEVDHVIGM